MLVDHFPFTYGHAHAWLDARRADGDRRAGSATSSTCATRAGTSGGSRSTRGARARRRRGRDPAGRGSGATAAAAGRCRSRRSQPIVAAALRCRATRRTRREPGSRPRRWASSSTRRSRSTAQARLIQRAGGRLADDAAREPDAHDAGRARLARRVDPRKVRRSRDARDHRRRLRLRRAPRGGADAPQTVAAFRRLLPLESRIIHVRWSGEGGWIPLGDLDLGLGPENATCYPSPGELILYPGRRQRDRAPARVRLRRVREQGRRARGQPLRDDRRGQREPARARAAHASGKARSRSLRERSRLAAREPSAPVSTSTRERDVLGGGELVGRVADRPRSGCGRRASRRHAAAASTPASWPAPETSSTAGSPRRELLSSAANGSAAHRRRLGRVTLGRPIAATSRSSRSASGARASTLRRHARGNDVRRARLDLEPADRRDGAVASRRVANVRGRTPAASTSASPRRVHRRRPRVAGAALEYDLAARVARRSP